MSDALDDPAHTFTTPRDLPHQAWGVVRSSNPPFTFLAHGPVGNDGRLGIDHE